jgi:hypothetical protein
MEASGLTLTGTYTGTDCRGFVIATFAVNRQE